MTKIPVNQGAGNWARGAATRPAGASGRPLGVPRVGWESGVWRQPWMLLSTKQAFAPRRREGTAWTAERDQMRGCHRNSKFSLLRLSQTLTVHWS